MPTNLRPFSVGLSGSLLGLLRLLRLLPALMAMGVCQVSYASSVSRLEILGTDDIGSINGTSFRRVHGIFHGSVDQEENVAGLKPFLAGRPALDYAVPFEAILPTDARRAHSIVVEVENRGRPTALGLLGGFMPLPPTLPSEVRYPVGMGNGFPFTKGVAYARVAWQTDVTASVPATAQGVGQVILRDFGRMLARKSPTSAADTLPTFSHRVLIGVSQSAWMANALVEEGFNRDPATGRGVYQGLFTRDGGGNVLAVNAASGGGAQAAYPLPDAVPLLPAELLRRPASDPIVVDILAYTDFYRLRASIFAAAPSVRGLHRYAVAAAHAPEGGYPDGLIFGTLKCNGGMPVPLNPLNDAAHVRALFVGLLRKIGVQGLGAGNLPPDQMFDLTAPGDAPINLLSGQTVLVPRIDHDAMPLGGIPMVEATLALGRPLPPAISPVGTRSITDVCGNFGGWEPLSAAELRQRYGTVKAYVEQADLLLGKQVKAGWLLAEDRAAELRRINAAAQRAFDNALR